MASVGKINFEIAKLQQEYGKVANEGDSQARIEAAGKEMNRDLHMSITVGVNDTYVPLTSGAANFPLPPGAFAAQRWTQAGDANNNDEGHALVLFGKWVRTEKTVRWMPAQRANAVPTAAHVISVVVIGDPARIDPLLQGIDFKSLAAVLAK
jgi:hypothetical protein